MGLLSKWVSPPRDRNSTRENISAPGSFVASAWGFLRRGTACFAPTRCVIFSQVYGCRILFSLFAVSPSDTKFMSEARCRVRLTRARRGIGRAREAAGHVCVMKKKSNRRTAAAAATAAAASDRFIIRRFQLFPASNSNKIYCRNDAERERESGIKSGWGAACTP